MLARILTAMALIMASGVVSIAALVQAQDEPVVTITASDSDAAEAGLEPGTFIVTRTGETGAALTVNYTVAGTASAGGDYSALSGSVVIAAGSTTGLFVVTPIDDTLIEGPETVIANVSASASNAYILGATTTATITIADNEQPNDLPVVTIIASDAAAGEPGANTGTFVVSRTGDTTAALGVNYALSGTASASDYVALGAVNIAADASSATITVTPVDDSLVEGSETVVATLSAFSTYTVGSANNATVTIADNDTASTLPVVSVVASDANAAEAGLDTGAYTFSRTGDTAAALAISYAVSGTATSGSDYAALAGVSIPAGSSSATVTVTPIDDSLAEGSETVIATLSASTAYTIGNANSATVSIADDEQKDEDEGDHPGGTRPGWGCGDKNHEHMGPPGNPNMESPCDRNHHGDDEDDDEDEHESVSHGNNGRGHDKDNDHDNGRRGNSKKH